MGKDDDSRRTKKYPQKNRVRNLAKTTNEISISVNASNDASKKTSDVKKTPCQKQNKQLVYGQKH